MTTKKKSDPKPDVEADVEIEEKTSEQLIADAAEIVGDVDLSNAPRLNPARALTPGNKIRVKGLVDRYNGFDQSLATEADAADLYDEITDFLGRCAVSKAEFEEWLISEAAFEQTFPLFIQLVKTVGELQRSSS